MGVLMFLLLLAAAGCAPAANDAPAVAKNEVDRSCKVDADCAVKDVGNCCGYYPQCVNKDSPTFPRQVKADCKAKGMSSVCGFAEIDSCECVENRCEAAGNQGELR